jgi:uncharacterized protein YPO0396
MRADLENLKTYDSAVTKECMTYSNHTASRIKEEIYKRHYLGRTALEERKIFLAAEILRVEEELTIAEKEEREARIHEDCLNRVLRYLPEMKMLFPSIANTVQLKEQIAVSKDELEKIDTKSFKDLENKRNNLQEELNQLKEDNDRLQNRLGGLNVSLSNYRRDLDHYTQSQEIKEEAIKYFSAEHPLMISECEAYAVKRLSETSIQDLTNTYETTLKNFRTRTETCRKEYSKLVAEFEHEFHYFLEMEPSENAKAETFLKRLETSELPEYCEKIARAYQDAEKEFKDHFISRLNENIEEARESFKEINRILRTLHFGRDQYWFHLEELGERKGQIEVIRQAAKIPSSEDTLFSQFNDPDEKKAVEDLFNKILNSPLDSKELRDICDYRTYFQYDIKIRELDVTDDQDKPVTLSLSKVLKERSGGESQTPYYVAIAASFYRFYKDSPKTTVRLVIFDEAFSRMDDERIGKILEFYNTLNLQIITSVPPEKIDAIAPYMDRINVISRFNHAVRVRECHKINETDNLDINMDT